ncbi:hypothetical protein H2204_003527 [Knufia peltigerae]|uniref:Xylanolytic transcriptional activator regulatory domain-containing protein n=1 Tax=Knufia peltigerae TaxID=1002370 RepID=A0AA38Y9B7_9EURO|nr:hypothetical protein H2204_003527 [Knufia peltigerae]
MPSDGAVPTGAAISVSQYMAASPPPTADLILLHCPTENNKDTEPVQNIETRNLSSPLDDWSHPMGLSLESSDLWALTYDNALFATPLIDPLNVAFQDTWAVGSSIEDPPLREDSTTDMLLSFKPSSRFEDLISQKRFGKIQKLWQSRSSRASRLMPDLWHNLLSSKRANIYCKPRNEALGVDAAHQRVSRWGFDDECRQQMQLTLNSLLHTGDAFSPQSLESYDFERRSRLSGTSSYNVNEVTLPSTETCQVALEIYFHQFHPMLPVIHIPTFSAKDAPFPMLFVLCLLGFSILGTPSATQLVHNTFPTVVQIVSAELQSSASGKGSVTDQLTTLVTALLTLSIASITGQDSRRMAQAEMLYVSLISMAQWHGLFSLSRTLSDLEKTSDESADEQKRWHAWSKIECVKRLIHGLVEIDNWFASYFSTTPMIRSETLRMIPPGDNKLFHANTASVWAQLVRNTGHQLTVSRVITTDFPLDHLTSAILPTYLAMTRHQIYETNHRLLLSSDDIGTLPALEPWRLYTQSPCDSSLFSRIGKLPETNATPLRKGDINAVISWHMSCMMLTANMQLFEQAAGQSGSAAVPLALNYITTWASTSTARRAVLHSAQVFKLLFHRRVSDVIHVHTVAALFRSALVMSFYLLTAPTIPQLSANTPLELFDEVDWEGVGFCGMQESSETRQLSAGAAEMESSPMRFIKEGGSFSITGVVHPHGYSSCGRVLLHAADLMQTIGKWKSRTFSHILHLLMDDLMDVDSSGDSD